MESCYTTLANYIYIYFFSEPLLDREVQNNQWCYFIYTIFKRFPCSLQYNLFLWFIMLTMFLASIGQPKKIIFFCRKECVSQTTLWFQLLPYTTVVTYNLLSNTEVIYF